MWAYRLAALTILLVSTVPSQAERLLVDAARDALSWGVDVGGEFPGATGALSVVSDAQRGVCVEGSFVFDGESRYSGVKWSGEIPTGNAIGFWVNLPDHTRAMVRIRDATDQEHMGGVTVPRGEWAQAEVPLAPGSFGAHWGGADDGKLHFPLKAVLIAVSRGPDRTRMRVRDLYAVVDDVRPADHWQVTFEPRVPSGIALRGERADYVVHVTNRGEQARECFLRVQADGYDGSSLAPRTERLARRGWRRASFTLRLPTDKLGYWRLSAELSEDGLPAPVEVVSGFAVAPRPRHYRKWAPDCYFGIQAAGDLEAAERLGVKAIRQAPGWRWAEARKGDVRWETYLDRVVESPLSHKMQVLLTVQAIAPGWVAWQDPDNPRLRNLPDPARMDEWERFVRQIAHRYRGKLAAIEIQNEPDLTCFHHVGLSQKEGLDYYAQLLRVGAKGAKAADPDVPIAGIDVSGGDFRNDLSFTRGVLDRGADALDLYTGHPYASPRYFGPGQHPKWPAENLMAEKCRMALDVLSDYGRPRRMWIGELGWGLLKTADPLSGYSLDFAACIAQALITGKTVPGVEKFLYFTLAGCDEHGYEYGLTRGRPRYPLPAALAYASAAYWLDGGKPVGHALVTPELHRATFFNSERRELTVAWYSQGAQVSVSPPASAPTGRWFDSFFGPLRARGPFTVGRLPVYWVLPMDEAGGEPAFLSQVTTRPAQPISLQRVTVASVDSLALIVRNRTDSVQPLQVTAGDTVHALRAPVSDGPVAVALPLSQPLPVGTPTQMQVSVSWAGTVQSRKLAVTLHDLPAPPDGVKADGRLDEWAASAPLEVTQRNQVLPPDPGIGWEGPRDLSLNAYLAADADALYFAALVTDDIHAAPADEPGSFWNSDSIQIVIDPRNDSLEHFDDNDREIGLVLGEGGPLAFITYPGQFRALDAPVGISRGQAGTVYEVAVPWQALNVPPPKPGDVMAINFIANDNDGQGRGYWMGLTPGIGEGKSPTCYRRFVLAGGL